MPEPEWQDPIVEEVRKARQEHAARFNYDLRTIFEDLRKRQAQSGHEVVSYPPRRLDEADDSAPQEGVA